MSDLRAVMEVRVVWMSGDDDEAVQRFMKALDQLGYPSPATWVANGLDLGAHRIDLPDPEGKGGVDLELVVEGPDHWARRTTEITDKTGNSEV